MKKYTIIFLTILAALGLTQCSKRENPLDAAQQHGRYWTLFFESNAIKNDKMDDFWFRNILVYTPPGYDSGDTLRPVATGIDSIIKGDTIEVGDTVGGNPDSIISIIVIPPETTFVYGDTLLGTYYPVLYLLHGYGGTQTYYSGLYDVGSLMDELISSGQIRPMIVVTPNATNNLGGGFYTNSDTLNDKSFSGRMQDFITDEVVHIIDSVYNTLPDRNHRGIAGHSMGGYGAVKIAMLRNDLFGSAASMSGPLTFWGDTGHGDLFPGILALLPTVFEENGFIPGDTAAFYRITPSPTKRLTSFMFAMGVAFSPNWMVAPVDSSYAHKFVTNGFVGYVDLPFDANGQLVQSVWNKWLENDVSTIFTGSAELLMPPHSGVFDSTALYIDAGSVDDLGMQYHARVFDGFATALGVNHQFEIYPSSGGSYIADHTNLISDRLRKVAKFHSDAFYPIAPTK